VPRACTVCAHGEIVAINQAIVGNAPLRGIAQRYAVSEDALRRHKQAHISITIAKAQEAAEVAQADTLLDRIRALLSKAESLLQQAEDAGDLRTAFMGIREARSCIETLMEVEGELDRRPTVNLVVSPEWLQLRGVLLESLSTYPEARMAVSKALTSIEVQHVA
jgi:hypothetical protein